MSKDTELVVPEEVWALYDEYNAMLKLRDVYINRPFGFKKAKECAIKSQLALRKFWCESASLHFDKTKGKGLRVENSKLYLNDEQES